jgi:GSH-dependent disulfide-bond oxidoreductase
VIDLHYLPTPNGDAVAIMLEACELPYEIFSAAHLSRLVEREVSRPIFDHLMPAIVDYDAPAGGDSVGLFQSAAIMMYLSERTDLFGLPDDLRAKYEGPVQWLMWQVANQAFRPSNNGADPDATRRLYRMLDLWLERREYICGDSYTIADMICYPWTQDWDDERVRIENFPNFARWSNRVGEKPAIRKAKDRCTAADVARQPARTPPERLIRAIRIVASVAGDPTHRYNGRIKR